MYFRMRGEKGYMEVGRGLGGQGPGTFLWGLR